MKPRPEAVFVAVLALALLLAGCAPAADPNSDRQSSGAGGHGGEPGGLGGQAGVSASAGPGFGGVGVAGGSGGGAGGAHAMSAGSGSSAGSSLVEASFATVRQVVVQAHCADASCHNGEAKPRLQDDATLHATLTGHVSEACGNLPVVTPGAPERSALIKLLKGPCGGLPRMPSGCVSGPVEEYTCLPPVYIEAIERWVKNGAPP